MTVKWYARGKEGFDKTKEIEKENEIRKKTKMTSRFFLRTGEEATIVFLDSNPFFCWVHQFKHNGKWGNYATCIKDIAPCPLCEAGLLPTWTAHYTIIDTRQFEYEGKVYKNLKKLFPAKGAVINILADLQKKYKDLRGCVFKVKRYQDKEVNTGSHFEYLGRLKNLEKKFEDTEPYKYEEVLAPPTKEQYKLWGFDIIELGADELETNDEVLDDDLEIDEPAEEIENEDIDLDFEEETEEPKEEPEKKSKKKFPLKKGKKAPPKTEEYMEEDIEDVLEEEDDEFDLE